jgi:capsular polysaccharide biosynthesis protein
MQQIRATLVRSVEKNSSRQARRIYVSRSGLSKNKRISNEEALLPLIKNFDFEVVFPERLSLADQISTFRDATVVLGAFGAGLTNILFCPPNSTLLELQDSLFAPREWYWKFSTSLGHEWRCYVGRTDDLKTLKWVDWPAATFNIDADGFGEFLQAALAHDAPDSQKQWWNHHNGSAPPVE